MRPVYEREIDRVKQRALAELLAQQWSLDAARLCKPFYPVDVAFERKGLIVGFAEIKVRRFQFGGPFGGYKNFFTSAAKVSTAINHAQVWKKPCVLLAGFSDGVYLCDIDQFDRDADGEPVVIWGGRDDRGDPHDDEPMLTYAWTKFREVSAT